MRDKGGYKNVSHPILNIFAEILTVRKSQLKFKGKLFICQPFDILAAAVAVVVVAAVERQCEKSRGLRPGVSKQKTAVCEASPFLYLK